MQFEVNILIILGMIAMLVTLIPLLATLLFGTDAFMLLSPVIKFGFHASSLIAVGLLLGDKHDREVFLDDGASVIFLLISIISLVYTSCKLIKSIQVNIQKKQHEIEQEKIRQEKEKQKREKEQRQLFARKDLDSVIHRADEIFAEMESGDRIIRLALLLESCGAELSYIRSHPKVTRVKELADELTVLERKCKELENILYS